MALRVKIFVVFYEKIERIGIKKAKKAKKQNKKHRIQDTEFEILLKKQCSPVLISV